MDDPWKTRVEEKLDEHTILLTKVDTHLEVYNDHLREHMRRSDALEKQVDELYKWKYYLVGALAIVTTMATLAYDIILTYLGK